MQGRRRRVDVVVSVDGFTISGRRTSGPCGGRKEGPQGRKGVRKTLASAWSLRECGTRISTLLLHGLRWYSVSTVLVQCGYSVNTVLVQCGYSVGTVLVQCEYSVGTV